MQDRINEVIRRIQYLLPDVEVTSQQVQKIMMSFEQGLC